MTEAQLQSAIIEAAHIGGFMVAHFRPAQTAKGWRTPVAADGAGFPDLVLAHPFRGVFFIECKSERGKLLPDQHRWAKALCSSGAEWHVLRPSDLESAKRWLIGERANPTEITGG